MIIQTIIIFLLGLVFGSFINSLIYRLYFKIPLWDRSFCLNCQKKLLARDLVPLLSFILLKGKCRFCKQKIKRQYFWVELITGILFVLVFWHYQVINLLLIRDLIFVLILLFILIFDWQYYLILDKIIWPCLIFCIFINLFIGFNWVNLFLGSLFGAGFFILQYLMSNGKWLGLGDVKLGVLLGFMLGLNQIILVLIIAYITGGLVAFVLLILKRKNFGDVLPLGSFLAAAGIIVLLIGEKVLNYILFS